MSETVPPPAAATETRSLRGWFADMPRWKKVSLLVAGALVVTGAVMAVVAPGAPAPADGAGAGTGPLGTGLVAGQPAGQPAAEAAEPAAKGVFRLGFSFLAGFCLGSFVRATLKIAAIAFGFWLAMTIGLAYFGLVEVNWAGIEGLWSHFAANVEAEWSSFRTFVTGSLPAAGLVTAGFAVGVKKH